MRVRALVVALAVIAAAAAAPRAAEANGRVPQSIKLRFRPGSTTDIFLGVTFGLMVSNDNAQTWRWICESAVGFSGTFDPDYEYSPSGAIFASTFDGLRYTRDGCNWSGVPAPLGTWLVTTVAIGPDGAIYAAAADPILGSGIFKSTDDGVSFQPTGSLGRPVDWFDTMEVAPSDPQRIYVTGYKLNGQDPRVRLMFRSDDGGATWEELPTTAFVGIDISSLQIMAIDPIDPDIVFVNLAYSARTLEHTLFRTATGGHPPMGGGSPWTSVLRVPAIITAAVVRASGDVWVTTPTQGMHRSTDGGAVFTQVSGLTYEAMCLQERPGEAALWLCATDLPPDMMALGRSTTGEAGTWEPKMRFRDIAGPVRCQPGNNQHDDCEVNLWCGMKSQLGATTEEIECPEEPVDAAIDSPTTPPPDDPKTCCGANGRPPGLEIGLGAVALLLLLRRRRRLVD
jgi:hypothetical protein